MRIKFKKRPIVFCLGFVFLMTVFSCRKEIANIFDKTPDNEVQWAKDYFINTLLKNEGNQAIYKNLNGISLKGEISKPNMKSPLWVRAKSGKTSRFEFVEVPLTYSRKISPVIKTRKEEVDTQVLQATFDRLIIYKDSKGRINQRIITYMPDKAYLARHKGDVSHNQIDNLDKDFDGFLIYKSWDENILFMLRLDKGVAKKIKLSKAILGVKKSLGGTSLSSYYGYEGQEGCEDYIYIVYEQICYYNNPDDSIPSHCDAPTIISESWIYTLCPGDPEVDCSDPANFDDAECIPPPECRSCPDHETPPLDSLIKKFCDNLTSQQKAIIENTASQLKDYNCATKYIYNHFDDANKTFEFCIGSGAGSGSYSSTTKSFNFTSNEAAANMAVMEHEFIHSFQDDTYSGGIAQYGRNQSTGVPNAGFVDIEFEQAVINDMMNYGNTVAMSGATTVQTSAYLAWINSVTANGTSFPKLKPGGSSTEIADYNAFITDYQYFLNIYNNISVNSSTALNFAPQALINLFNNINRNCP